MHDHKAPPNRDLDKARVAANDNDVATEVIDLEELETERVSFDEDDRFDFSDDDELGGDVDDMFK
jgi:hypothetical protein